MGIARWRNVAGVLWGTAAVAASAMAFPSVLVWMIGFWLGWHSWSVWRGRPGGVPLVCCLGIVLVKRPPWFPELIALAAVMVLAVGVSIGRRKLTSPRANTVAWGGVLVLWSVWSWAAWSWHSASHCNHRVGLFGMRPVACLGDSLTAGECGDSGYVSELRRRITLPVLDFSRPGIDTTEAMKSLPTLLESRPQVAVVELGGHDYLKGRTRASTEQNLETIINACRKVGAEVVLMEIPRGLCTDPFSGLERELARKYDLELISDTAIRKLVLWSPQAPPGMWFPHSHLSDDGLHANAAGNRLLADEVTAALTRLYAKAEGDRHIFRPSRRVQKETRNGPKNEPVPTGSQASPPPPPKSPPS